MSDLYIETATRITAECPAVGFARAATTAAQAEDEVLGEVATVLVVPAAERWDPVREAGMFVSQAGRVGLSCVVGLAGVDVHAQWSQVRQELLTALRGWIPADPDAAGPLEYAGARLLAYSAEAGGRWLHSFDFNLPVRASYEHQA